MSVAAGCGKEASCGSASAPSINAPQVHTLARFSTGLLAMFGLVVATVVVLVVIAE